MERDGQRGAPRVEDRRRRTMGEDEKQSSRARGKEGESDRLVGWISIQCSTELLIQPAQFGPESNQGSHLVTNQGPGWDVTAAERWISWELGGVNAMNHIGPL
ncbi:hypothetical protein EYF80_019409 [Liparis tanakae]|uniref:Uncharacterized protein n=1 Tax=Liparis tanakae TaxID=230148 RepID=A0A4Z2HZI7_9TELE|nr:hypothetical protein EYF80_019409 [Liparis tanakae]